jgi:hypothetical protein
MIDIMNQRILPLPEFDLHNNTPLSLRPTTKIAILPNLPAKQT